LNDNSLSCDIKAVFPVGAKLYSKHTAAENSRSFWIVYGLNGQPRWILPPKNPSISNLLGQWRPYGALSFLMWKFLVFAYRAGLLNYVPFVQPLYLDVSNCNWCSYGWLGEKPPLCLTYVGTPGKSRKAVMWLLQNTETSVVQIAKIPIGTNSKRSILYESKILKNIENDLEITAPKVIYTDNVRGVSLQSFVHGESSKPHFSVIHLNYLLALVYSSRCTSIRKIGIMLSDFIEGRDAKNSIGIEVIRDLTDRLNDNTPIPTALQHGDFCPWNLKVQDDGSLTAVDWEAADVIGFPLYDLVYFHAAINYHLKTKVLFPPGSKVLIAEYVKQTGINPQFTQQIIAACLALNWAKCIKAGDEFRAQFLIDVIYKNEEF